MNTAEFLTISAAIVPDRVAVVGEDDRVTYEDLQSRVNRLAQALQALGVGKGANVGIMAVNSPAFAEIYYASAAVGATFVPLNYRAKPEELSYMVNAADVNVLFVEERYWSIYQDMKAAAPGLKHAFPLGFEAQGTQSYAALRDSGEDIPVFADVDDADPTLIIYTSGTTSLPKGVVLSYRALTALVVNTQAPADPSSDQEVVLVSVPFYHIAGATTLMSAVFSGRRLVILPAFDPQSWLAAVERERVTHAFVVPTMLKRVMEVDDFDQYDLGTLRLITYGAAPMPFEVVRHACDMFPPRGIGLMNAYGQTEATGSMSFLAPDDHRLDGTPEENEKKVERLRSVGRPMPDIQVAILAPDGREQPQDEEGEICIRGDRVMRGYNKRDEDTGEALRDGWLHTGDVGKLDQDGYLFITGRLKDMIIRGGENIAPAEIENVLEDHPAIAEAAIIGVPDNEWGEIIKAILVSDRGDRPDPEELTTYVKTRLASYKAPALYEWVDELPRNHLGKILKTELRDKYGAAPTAS
ncbi:MAG: long-chain-fatty-acid--CoA ligase [Chloroflexi bacterium]|nr:long-chain-fatty-acid--CoA ligase [Chloroflexota bacterium]MDA1003145.1 long-chain-fatty-acid--CoA ligase [Chloroflexota bacterium]